MRRLLILVLVACTLGGCKWFQSSKKDNITPPAELVEFAPGVSVNKLWSRGIGEGAGETGFYLRPAISAGNVFAASAEGSVAAYDGGSGSEIWRVSTGAGISGGPGAGDGLVVVGGVDGDVVAFDIATGAQRWTAEVSSEVISAPVISAGLVVVRSHDGRVFGFDATDGRRRWVYDRGVPLLSLRGNGSPLIVGDVVVVGFDNGKIVGLGTSDGVLRWEQASGTAEGKTELERMVDVDGEIQAEGDELFLAGFRGQAMGLSASSGRSVWTRDISSYAGVALDARHVYVVDAAGTVFALDRRTGSTVWKQEALANRWLTTPVVSGGHLVVGDLDGYLHLLSTEDGSFKGRERVSRDALRSGAVASGEMLWQLTLDGDLVAFLVGS